MCVCIFIYIYIYIYIYMINIHITHTHTYIYIYYVNKFFILDAINRLTVLIHQVKVHKKRNVALVAS